MRVLLKVISICLLIGCSPSIEMDSTTLIPISGNWDLVTTYGGSEEDIADAFRHTIAIITERVKQLQTIAAQNLDQQALRVALDALVNG